MYNLRTEIENSIFMSLKIHDNTFNRKIVRENIELISENDLEDFYSNLFSDSHKFLNGLDRVAKVAEMFKPKNSEDDEITKEAKRLISGIEDMNTLLFDEAHKTGEMFEDFVRGYDFKNVTEKSMAILNNVRPYYDIKELVINIRRYQTSVDTLNAFKQAIKQSNQNESLAIDRRVFKQIAKN